MLEYWLSLQYMNGVGNLLGKRLVEHFGDPESVFHASKKQLMAVQGIGSKIAASISAGPDLGKARKELKALEHYETSIIPFTDPRYPQLLKTIYDFPLILNVRGSISEDDSQFVAIVGSRNASSYGIRMARKLAGALAQKGITIVSGFALGIDTAAHQGALAAGGRTIAVLGCGMDINYPKVNENLRKDVARSGALVTEFPIGTKAEPENFPRRNRIISGISLGVVVVEAGMKSGSFITAGHALDQGRDVFAVPGQADSPRSKGCHYLIKQGAKLTDSPDDILEEIAPSLKVQKKSGEDDAKCINGLGEDEQSVLTLCGSDPIHIDRIVKETGIDVGRLSGILLDLELKNLVQQLPGTRYRRKATN